MPSLHSAQTRLDMHFSGKHKLLDIWIDLFFLAASPPPSDVGRKRKSRGAWEHVSFAAAERNGGVVAWEQRRGHVQPGLNDPIPGCNQELSTGDGGSEAQAAC